jgi:hypothetical protein
MSALRPLLKELHEVNTAIAAQENDLKNLRHRRQWLNGQISEYLLADAEMDAITKGIQKTREALTL